MNTPHSGNGSNGKPPTDDDEFPYPAIFAAIHRDPEAFLDYVRTFERVLRSAGEQAFTPCTDPCPICQPALWLADSY